MYVPNSPTVETFLQVKIVLTPKKRYIDVHSSLLFLSCNTNNLIVINAGILILLQRCTGLSEYLLFPFCKQVSDTLFYKVYKKKSTWWNCGVLIHMATTRNLVEHFRLLHLKHKLKAVLHGIVNVKIKV